jgi:hypothetical protein
VNWLNNLLRQVTVSKTLTAAVFLTSATLVFGPKLLPSTIEAMPKEWQFVPAATLVFSACFLLAWLGAAAWRWLQKLYWEVVHSHRARSVSDQELEFLTSMARNPDSPVNLRTIDYAVSPLSRYELTRLATSLERKGLVRFGPYERAVIMLTARGEHVAVQSIEDPKRAA